MTTECTGLKPSGAGVEAELGAGPELFDFVVLCVGFGTEPTAPSYWDSQTVSGDEEPGHTVVVGTGDGGVIEAAELCIKNFDIRSLLAEVDNLYSARSLREIREFEETERSAENSDVAEFYSSNAVINPKLLESLKARLRTESAVSLIGRHPSPVTSRPSPLNRLILAHLHQLEAFSFIEGSHDGHSGTEVCVEIYGGCIHVAYDHLLVRAKLDPDITRFDTGVIGGQSPGPAFSERQWPNSHSFAPQSDSETADDSSIDWGRMVTKATPPEEVALRLVEDHWPGFKYFSKRKLLAMDGFDEEALDTFDREQQYDAYVAMAGEAGRFRSLDELEAEADPMGLVAEVTVDLTVASTRFSQLSGSNERLPGLQTIVLAHAEPPIASGLRKLCLFGSADNWVAGEYLLFVRAWQTSETEQLTELIADVLGLDRSHDPLLPEDRVSFVNKQMHLTNPKPKHRRLTEQLVYKNARILFEVDCIAAPENDTSSLQLLGKLVSIRTDTVPLLSPTRRHRSLTNDTSDKT